MMKRKLTRFEKSLIIKRLIAFIAYGAVCMAVGSGISLLYWVVDSVYNNENTPILIVAMFSGWLILGVVLGVVIRPVCKH